MTQSLERAGDHAKNLAEEVCHFVSGRSIRHLLMVTTSPKNRCLSNGCGTSPESFSKKWRSSLM